MGEGKQGWDQWMPAAARRPRYFRVLDEHVSGAPCRTQRARAAVGPLGTSLSSERPVQRLTLERVWPRSAMLGVV